MAKLGDKTGHVMELDCETPLQIGVPLIHAEAGVLRSQPVTGQGIAQDAVIGAHIKALDHVFFGLNLSGAEAIFDGTSTVLGLAPSSSTYTLTKDVSVGNLVVATGVTIKCAGFKLSSRTCTLQGTAVIHNDGGDGSVGTDGTNVAIGVGGNGGAGPSNGTLSGGANGGKGGDGGFAATVPTGGSVGTNASNSIGGVGQAGGTGGTGTGHAGGSGASASTTTATTASIDSLPAAQALIDSTTVPPVIIKGGSSGGGGGGGGGGTTGSSSGGGGGGGGAGAAAGCVVCSFAILDVSTWTGRISANGGAGGHGGAGFWASLGGGAGGAGGGGGGGGGCVLIVRRIVGASAPTQYLTPGSASSLSLGSGTVSATGGAAGAAGSQNAGLPTVPTAATAGTSGTVLFLNMSEPPANVTAVPPRPARPSIHRPRQLTPGQKKNNGIP